jgi:hypothetical protein
MTARFEINIQVSPPGLTPRGFQRIAFSVGTAEKTVIAAADNFSSPHQYRADQGIRTDRARSPDSKAQCSPHKMRLVINRRRHADTHRLLPSSTLTSDMNSPMSLKERYTDAKRT